MGRISFKKYLEMGVARNLFGETPEGDFAADALRDKTFQDFTTWRDLEFYLKRRKACREAIVAAGKVFKKWSVGK